MQEKYDRRYTDSTAIAWSSRAESLLDTVALGSNNLHNTTLFSLNWRTHINMAGATLKQYEWMQKEWNWSRKNSTQFTLRESAHTHLFLELRIQPKYTFNEHGPSSDERSYTHHSMHYMSICECVHCIRTNTHRLPNNIRNATIETYLVNSETSEPTYQYPLYILVCVWICFQEECLSSKRIRVA